MISTAEYYIAQCDNCGEAWVNDHYGWSAMNDKDGLIEIMKNDEWHFGDGIDGEEGKCYCPKCYSFNDEDVFKLVTPINEK